MRRVSQARHGFAHVVDTLGSVSNTNATRWDYVIIPSAPFRIRWDLFLLFLLSYVAIFTPYQISFLSKQHDLVEPERWLFWFVLDRFIDVVFVVDIGINFRSAWFNEDGDVVFEPHKACRKYFRGWFVCDVCSVVPFGALKFMLDTESSSTGSAMRIPRILKLAKIMKLLKVAKASPVISRLEQNLEVRHGYVRLTKFAAVTVLAAHWLACLYMLTSEASKSGSTCTADGDLVQESWVDVLYCSPSCENDVPVGGCTRLQLYVASLHWSMMTLTTIGYGDVPPKNVLEMAFSVFAMLIGAGFFGFIMGTCCSVVERLDSLTVNFHQQLDSMSAYMELCRMPARLRRRIRNYVWNYKDFSGRFIEADMLKLMSPSLRQEVLLFNHGTELTRIPHFHGAPDVFLMTVASMLEQRLFGPQDIVTCQGAHGEPFYILGRGEVSFLRKKMNGVPGNMYHGSLKHGGFWNERQLIFDSPADTSVRAETFVSANVLEGCRVRELIRRYPTGFQQCRKLVLKQLWAIVRHSIVLAAKDFKLWTESRGARKKLRRGAVAAIAVKSMTDPDDSTGKRRLVKAEPLCLEIPDEVDTSISFVYADRDFMIESSDAATPASAHVRCCSE